MGGLFVAADNRAPVKKKLNSKALVQKTFRHTYVRGLKRKSATYIGSNDD